MSNPYLDFQKDILSEPFENVAVPTSGKMVGKIDSSQILELNLNYFKENLITRVRRLQENLKVERSIEELIQLMRTVVWLMRKLGFNLPESNESFSGYIYLCGINASLNLKAIENLIIKANMSDFNDKDIINEILARVYMLWVQCSGLPISEVFRSDMVIEA